MRDTVLWHAPHYHHTLCGVSQPTSLAGCSISQARPTSWLPSGPTKLVLAQTCLRLRLQIKSVIMWRIHCLTYQHMRTACSAISHVCCSSATAVAYTVRRLPSGEQGQQRARLAQLMASAQLHWSPTSLPGASSPISCDLLSARWRLLSSGIDCQWHGRHCLHPSREGPAAGSSRHVLGTGCKAACHWLAALRGPRFT
jgi:hypothetical protein